MSLKDKSCTALPDGSPALDDGTANNLLREIPAWAGAATASGQPRQLRRTFQFKDFLGAMAFLNRLASLAEAEQHHPDFCVHYNKVDVTLWTHSVGGLSENDFIVAAKLDDLFA
ncbi:MAG: 4a-hydroxytetrahydrobiopterin dehydratase [Verrucomicrobiota bacterium]